MGVLPPDSGRGVYGISVAAELTGLGVQTLRLYESRGLLEPARTDGGTRRYSADDLDRLQRIGTLLGAGLNLAGIRMVLDLQDANAQLQREISQLHGESTALRGQDGEPAPTPSGRKRTGVPTTDAPPEGATGRRPAVAPRRRPATSPAAAQQGAHTAR